MQDKTLNLIGITTFLNFITFILFILDYKEVYDLHWFVFLLPYLLFYFVGFLSLFVTKKNIQSKNVEEIIELLKKSNLSKNGRNKN